ncbi:MAG: ATP-binding protein, partial [Verrucomicrobiota bacterium]
SFLDDLISNRVLENYEFELKRRDGSIASMLGKVIGVFGRNGKLNEIKGYLIDITERVQLQEQFLQSQKMEAIGRLSEGIAHDFNNLLTPIIGYGRLILDKADIKAPFDDDLAQIVRAGERATDLTRKLLSFGRKQDVNFQNINLNQVVYELDPLLRKALGPEIELTLNLSEDAGTVKVDVGPLEQVIMNLAVNARDALPPNGRLSLSTRNEHLKARSRPVRSGLPPGDYVIMTVQDNGCGMTPEVRKRAFDPFFTTKEENKGTGLGLSTVYGIVKQFKGWIDLDSKINVGTTFDIYLPRIDEPADEAPLYSDQEDQVPLGNETILLVEDDDTVRTATVRILESLGYTLLTARNGGEALLLAEQYKEPIDLLLTDVAMPMMPGNVVAERLRQIRGDFKVLFMSGYGVERMEGLDFDLPMCDFIQKPCTHRTLGDAIRRVLDES